MIPYEKSFSLASLQASKHYFSYEVGLHLYDPVVGNMVSKRYRASANHMDEDHYDFDSEEEEHDSDSDLEEENVEIVFGNFQRDSDLDMAPVIPIKLIKPIIDGSSIKIGEITCFLVTFNSSTATPRLRQWSFPSSAMAAMNHHFPVKCKNGDEDLFSNTEEEAIPDPPPSRNSVITHHRHYRDRILCAEHRPMFVPRCDVRRQTCEEAATKRSQILSSSFVTVEAASKTAKKPKLVIDLHSSGSGRYKIELSTAAADYIAFNPGGNHIFKFLLLLFSFSSAAMVTAPPSFKSFFWFWYLTAFCVTIFEPGGNRRHSPLFSATILSALRR